MCTNFLKQQRIKIVLALVMMMTTSTSFCYKITIKNGTDGILKRIYIEGSPVPGAANNVIGEVDDIGPNGTKTIDTESFGERPLANLTIMYNYLSRGYKLPVDFTGHMPIGNGHEQRDITLTVKVAPQYVADVRAKTSLPRRVNIFIIEEGIQ